MLPYRASPRNGFPVCFFAMSRNFFLILPVLWILRSGACAAPRDEKSFVEVVALDRTIQVELPYATKENFTGHQLYPVARCFLRKEVAEQLVAAHRSLKPLGYGIKIWDGYRPRSVQYKMWEVFPKPGYVGDPKRGSKHNRGAAVDVTLFDLATGEELEMPTSYDHFGLRAHSSYSPLPEKVEKNRRLLQDTMREHGFQTIPKEWWHFDFRDWEEFPLEDIQIEDLAEREDQLFRELMKEGPPRPQAVLPE